MDKQEKYLAALNSAAKKSTNKAPVKAKIKGIKKKQAHFDWLSQ